MSKEIKPCPFCGLNVANVTTCAQLEDCENFETCNDAEFYCVVCDATKGGCDASGGYRQTWNEAIESWNRRDDDEKSNISG